MSRKHRLNLGLAGAAVVFAALAIVLSLAGAEEQPVADAQQQTFDETLATIAPPITAPPVTEPPATLPPVPPTVATVPPVVDPPPVVEYASGSIEDMVCAVFGDQCAKALSVVACESGFNPGTVGGAGERGLFQIHPVHSANLGAYGGWDAMFDPASNIAYAYALYSRSGWGPWTCA